MQSELETMAYYEETNPPKTITGRIKKSIIDVLRELLIVEKLNVAAEDAHKAWQTAQRIEKRELRAKAAAAASYKMDVSEE